MTTLTRALLALGTLLAALALGHAAPAAAPDHPHVTLCQTRAQTGCLWVDGQAEWH